MATPRPTFESFTKRAVNAHGSRYTYFETEFAHDWPRIRFECSRHGLKFQLAGKHIYAKTPCDECRHPGPGHFYETELFLEKAILDFGDIYEYRGIENLKGSRTRIEVICSVHGAFSRTLQSLFGRDGGCATCRRFPTYDEFVEKARLIHRSEYDYSPEGYDGRSITVLCKVHGPFKHSAGTHLEGHGCWPCRQKKKAKKTSFSEFKKKASKVHQNKYTYLKEDYNGVGKKVAIECKVHGVFFQIGSQHLLGKGCKSCNRGGGGFPNSGIPSWPESEIARLLKEKEIEFEQERSFPTLLSPLNGVLRIDFYLPSYATFIEFDGKHHREAVFGSTEAQAQERLARQIANDEVKNTWAKNNGFRLFRLTNPKSISEDITMILSQVGAK